MDILQSVQDLLEGRIDFQGQVLAERVAQLGLGTVTVRWLGWPFVQVLTVCLYPFALLWHPLRL